MKKLSGYLLAGLSMLVFECNDPVNPFLNDTEAQAVFYSQPFTDGDSVSIFTTVFFPVVVNFREHVNYYTVHIEDNRLWRHSDSTVTNSQMSSEPQMFSFSFNDTGSKEIVLTTQKKNGRKLTERVKLYAFSPLHQDSIFASKGDTVALQTPSVGDPVTYTWNFRNGEIVRSAIPALQYRVETMFAVAQGELYITDGTVRSPSVAFSIIDPELPLLTIHYEIQNLVRDTIFTSQAHYELTVLLDGASTLKTATVNGSAFRSEDGVTSDIRLKAVIEIPDSQSALVKHLDIYIQDGYGRVFSDKLYLKYRSDVKSDVHIHVMNPADSSTVHDSLIHMYGIIRGSAADSVGAVFATINNTATPLYSNPQTDKMIWSFDLNLTPGWNTITIHAIKDSSSRGNVLASMVHHLYYLPTILITCMNDSVLGDTVFTGVPFIDFTVQVTTSFQIGDAKVNSIRFDDMEFLDAHRYKFTKYLRDLDNNVRVLRVEVASQDGQVYPHTFYIRYVEGIVVGKPTLDFVAPGADSIITNISTYKLYGKIERHLQFGTVYLFSSVNGEISSGYSLVKSDSNWNFSVPLNDGWNVVAVDVYEDSLRSGSSLARAVTTIKFSNEYVDSVEPAFVSITTGSGSVLVNGLVSNAPNLDLNIIVTDNVKPTKVIVNNTLQAQTADSHHFSCTVPLSHAKGSLISLCAYDKEDNSTCVSYTACYNTAPQFLEFPESGTFFAESTYTFRVRVNDADNDEVTVTVLIESTGGETILPIDDNGFFSWLPSSNDIGQKAMTINAWDGYEKVTKVVQVSISESAAQPIPVKWLTQFQEFRNKYLADVDTLQQTVVVNSLTGTKPFTFEVFVDNKSIPVSGDYKDSIRISWLPSNESVGLKTMRIIVKDSLDYSDTLRVTLQIDAPPSITVKWQPTTFSYIEQDTTIQISAYLSSTSPARITIPCAMEWLLSNVSHSDILIPDTSYLVFNPGDAVASISVQLKDDDEVEFDEHFSIRFISMPDYVRLVSGSRFTGTIIDDDRVSYSFEHNSASSSEASTQRAFAIILSKAVPHEIIIRCSIDSSSTAKSDDFTLLTETVTFKPYITRGDVQFKVNNDNLFENDETIVFKLSSQSQSTIPGTITTYVYTIENDDFRVAKVKFAGINIVYIGEDDQNATLLEVTLSEPLGVPLTVKYHLNSESSATFGVDYSLVPKDSITFMPGMISAILTVTPIRDNFHFERSEWFQINLKSVSNTKAAEIVSPSSKMVYIRDNY